MIKETLDGIREKALEAIAQAADPDKLNEIRVSVLGKKGELTGILKSMKDVAPEDRPKVGQLVNDTRAEIEAMLDERKQKFEAALLNARLAGEAPNPLT